MGSLDWPFQAFIEAGESPALKKSREINKTIISEFSDCFCGCSVLGGMKWGEPAGGSWLKEAITTVQEGGDESLIELRGSGTGK